MQDNEKNRLIRIIYTLANLLVLSNFLMFGAVVDRARLTITNEVIAWAIFIGVLVAVNTWVYFAFYRTKKSSA
jgi:hypothetical protein